MGSFIGGWKEHTGSSRGTQTLVALPPPWTVVRCGTDSIVLASIGKGCSVFGMQLNVQDRRVFV
jgi:hypothetical protein